MMRELNGSEVPDPAFKIYRQVRPLAGVHQANRYD